MRMVSRLGVRFVVLVVSILSLTLLVSASWFVEQQKQQLQEQLLDREKLIGNFLAAASVESILSYDFVTLENYVKDTDTRPDVVFSAILDSNSIPLTNYINTNNPYVRNLANGGEFTSIADLLQVALQSPSVTVATFPIEYNQRQLGSVIVGISNERLEQEIMDYFVLQLAVYSTIILFLSLSIYLVFRFNVLQPIHHLINGARRISDGHYDEPVAVTSSDEMGELTETFNSMMSEVRKDRELLNFQANFDSLTGLPNRIQAVERLGLEISRAQREGHGFAIIFIDLNNFKYVNDTMGHMAGDELLAGLSKRFRSVLRGSDIIARLGGDEFLVILPTATRPAESKEVAQRLIDSLEDAIMVHGREVFIRCSMGIALYPTDGKSAEELMANADNAMYQSKLAHTDDISFFAPEMNQIFKERLELEHDMHLALEQQQFKLYYQPIYSIKEQRVVGAEVLLRWLHPKRGIIHPLTFIPLAESTGRIIQIGRWSLHSALTSVRDLLEQGLNPGYVTVNVSRVQLTRDFEAMVQSALDLANLPPSRLRLEVTESALMEHYGELPEMLRRLDNLGVKLVLDDFGTGFSSLNYLKHFPFHTLKIDKSFIDNVPDNEDDASLVRGIIAMARSLGLTVVSEGVERDDQYRFLLGSDVDAAQGYLFARPMSYDDYITYLLKQQDSANASSADGKSVSIKKPR